MTDLEDPQYNTVQRTLGNDGIVFPMCFQREVANVAERIEALFATTSADIIPDI